MKIKETIFILLLALFAGNAGNAEALTLTEDSCDVICIQVIACGINDKGDLKTFPTPCKAACSGYQPIYYTECKNENRTCQNQYKPVCGVAPDGLKRTYLNRCLAKNSEARRITQGACGQPIPRYKK